MDPSLLPMTISMAEEDCDPYIRPFIETKDVSGPDGLPHEMPLICMSAM